MNRGESFNLRNFLFPQNINVKRNPPPSPLELSSRLIVVVFTQPRQNSFSRLIHCRRFYCCAGFHQTLFLRDDRIRGIVRSAVLSVYMYITFGWLINVKIIGRSVFFPRKIVEILWKILLYLIISRNSQQRKSISGDVFLCRLINFERDNESSSLVKKRTKTIGKRWKNIERSLSPEKIHDIQYTRWTILLCKTYPTRDELCTPLIITVYLTLVLSLLQDIHPLEVRLETTARETFHALR